MTQYVRIACLAIFIAILSGCSTKIAYLSIQEAAKQQCLRQPISEQSACQARQNKEDFETYTKKRGSQ